MFFSVIGGRNQGENHGEPPGLRGGPEAGAGGGEGGPGGGVPQVFPAAHPAAAAGPQLSRVQPHQYVAHAPVWPRQVGRYGTVAPMFSGLQHLDQLMYLLSIPFR